MDYNQSCDFCDYLCHYDHRCITYDHLGRNTDTLILGPLIRVPPAYFFQINFDHPLTLPLIPSYLMFQLLHLLGPTSPPSPPFIRNPRVGEQAMPPSTLFL